MPADRVAVHGLISSQARVLKLARLFTAQANHIAVTDAIDEKAIGLLDNIDASFCHFYQETSLKGNNDKRA